MIASASCYSRPLLLEDQLCAAELPLLLCLQPFNLELCRQLLFGDMRIAFEHRLHLRALPLLEPFELLELRLFEPALWRRRLRLQYSDAHRAFLPLPCWHVHNCSHMIADHLLFVLFVVLRKRRRHLMTELASLLVFEGLGLGVDKPVAQRISTKLQGTNTTGTHHSGLLRTSVVDAQASLPLASYFANLCW